MELNKIIRQCDKCNYTNNQDNFVYIGNGEFQCPSCFKKWTHIKEVVYPVED